MTNVAILTYALDNAINYYKLSRVHGDGLYCFFTGRIKHDQCNQLNTRRVLTRGWYRDQQFVFKVPLIN